MDGLHEKIRKRKNPGVLCLDAERSQIPGFLLAREESEAAAYGCFCMELLQGLQSYFPAVRVSMSAFLLYGAEGAGVLRQVLQKASDLGYYIILDLPEMLSSLAARRTAQQLQLWQYDALVISGYLGTDIVKPFALLCKEQGKDLFCMVRSSNKSAGEIQDLLAAGRLVHMVAADLVNRQAEQLLDKCGFSRIGIMVSATNGESIRTLRGKYPRLFLLVDGYDAPNGNGKNCSFAFNKMGHGAAVCAGSSILAAWQEAGEEESFVEAAQAAAERMKKNLGRYMIVL